jgi:hypothetical protein
MKRGLSLALLLLVVLLALLLLEALELGDYGVTYSGASPFNTLWDGTSAFVDFLSQKGGVVIVRNWEQAKGVRASECTILFFISPEKSYSNRDLAAIRDIFREGNVAIAVLDEGAYGNQVLEAIGAPVRIQALSYIGSAGNFSIVYGYANISSRVLYLAYAFVSPVVLQSGGECREVAFAQNHTVGAICSIDGKRVAVLGDGSLATNAALQNPSQLNPYRQLLSLLINEVCRNSSSHLFLVDATSYRARLMTLEELVNSYGIQKALSLYINPARYLHYTLYSLPESTALLAFSIASIALAVLLVTKYAKKVCKEFY